MTSSTAFSPALSMSSGESAPRGPSVCLAAPRWSISAAAPGEQAVELSRRGYRVAASDFCLPMLALAEPKYRRQSRPPRGFAADALATPFADAQFDGATVSFGLRNVSDLDSALRELAPVAASRRPARGARVRGARASPAAGRLYLFYFRRILPLVGRLLSPRGSAYSYLPSSVLEFPQRAGLRSPACATPASTAAAWRDLSGGIVCLYTGEARRLTRLLDGKALAAQLRAEVAHGVRELVAAGGRAPGLTAVLVGDDPASQVYVGSQDSSLR